MQCIHQMIFPRHRPLKLETYDPLFIWISFGS